MAVSLFVGGTMPDSMQLVDEKGGVFFTERGVGITSVLRRYYVGAQLPAGALPPPAGFAYF